MKVSAKYLKALDKNTSELTKEDVLIFLKEDIMRVVSPFYHEALSDQNWNSMLNKIEGLFRGAIYRDYIHDAKRLITRQCKDAIYEFTSKYFQLGFLYIHLRDNKLWINLNVF